jgi:ABC-type phosphate transport system substrate-binding protein
MPILNNSMAAVGILLLLSLAAGPAVATEPMAVVPVVSAKSPLTTLSKNQLIDIFLGKSSHFPDGNLAVPIDQPEGSTLREDFYLQFAGKSPAQLHAHWSKIIFTGRGHPPQEAADSTEVKKRLRENPSAIGYIDARQVDASVKVLEF